LAKYVVLGGYTVTKVAGAVPKVAPVVAVPPEMLSDDPAAEPPGSVQVVVNVIAVPELVALRVMYCPV